MVSVNFSKSVVGIALLAVCGLAAAQAPISLPPAAPVGAEYGRVISTQPVVQQVNTSKQVCAPVAVKESRNNGTSGAGAIVGAIAGGAIGNAIGHGNGRAATTGLGVMGGAILGSMIGQSGGESTTTTKTACSAQAVVENRTVAFNVVYEYAGKQYTTQMPNNPGAWVQLSIQPVVQGATSGVVSQPMVSSPAVISEPIAVEQPAPVVIGSPVVVAPTFVPAYVSPIIAAPVVYSPAVINRPVVQVSVPLVVGYGYGHSRPVRTVVQPVVQTVVVVQPKQHRHVHTVSYPQVGAPVVVAPVVIEPRMHRPGHVYPQAVPVAPAAPAYNHIKGEHRERQYY